MTKLINSIFENYYVPPIIFNVTKVDGHPQRTAIDGKQRLTSIMMFLAGKIPCTDSKGAKWYYVHNGEKPAKKNILPESIRNEFRRKELLCIEYKELARAQEEDMFARVQLGMGLSAAEKLDAATGPWRDFAHQIMDKYPHVMELLNGERKKGKFNRIYCSCYQKKGLIEIDYEKVLQTFCLLLEADKSDNGISPWNINFTKLSALQRNTTLLDDPFKARVQQLFTIYGNLATNYPSIFQDNDYKLVKTFSPIEFLAVAMLLDKYGDDRNLGLFRGDILQMREHVRASLRDLRANTATWKCLMGYVEKLETYRGGLSTVPQSDEPRRKRTRTTPPESPVTTPTSLALAAPQAPPLAGGAVAPSVTPRISQSQNISLFKEEPEESPPSSLLIIPSSQPQSLSNTTHSAPRISLFSAIPQHQPVQRTAVHLQQQQTQIQQQGNQQQQRHHTFQPERAPPPSQGPVRPKQTSTTKTTGKARRTGGSIKLFGANSNTISISSRPSMPSSSSTTPSDNTNRPPKGGQKISLFASSTPASTPAVNPSVSAVSKAGTSSSSFPAVTRPTSTTIPNAVAARSVSGSKQIDSNMTNNNPFTMDDN